MNNQEFQKYLQLGAEELRKHWIKSVEALGPPLTTEERERFAREREQEKKENAVKFPHWTYEGPKHNCPQCGCKDFNVSMKYAFVSQYDNSPENGDDVEISCRQCGWDASWFESY